MKKVLAILVALLMLALPIASAETVLSFADPVLTLNLGEEMKIDLTGLKAALAIGEIGDITAGKGTITGDGEELLAAYFNVVGDTVLFTADGLSNVYSAKVPEKMANKMEGFDISELDIDIEGIMNTVMESVEVDGDTVRIPYTAVNDVLASIAPALEDAQIPGLDVSGLSDEVEQMKASNSGVNAEGTFTETDTGLQLSCKAFLVEDGVAADEAILTLDATYSEDGIDVTVDAGESGKLHFAMIGEQVTIGGSAMGLEGELTGKLNISEEDVELVELDAADAIDAETLTDEQNDQLLSELQEAVGGVLGFVYGALSGDAA